LIVIGLVLALFLNPVSILISILSNIVTLFGLLPWDPLSFLRPVGDAAGWIFPVTDSVAALIHKIVPLGIEPVASDRFGGFLLSITIGMTAIVCSLPMGILLALGRQSDMPLVKMLSVGFIEFIRGVPLITMLFTATLLLQYFLPPGTNFDVILRVIIMVTVFSAAYIAEVIRGGLAALPRGQYEAADALGLDYWQAQRHIIMPQALKISIPGIVSSFIGLFKDTTLVALVGLLDPLQGITKIVRADIAWKGLYWEPYLFVGLIFFVFCFGMSRYSMYLENRLKRDHR
jgi:general L-amino acid transport system permease protein